MLVGLLASAWCMILLAYAILAQYPSDMRIYIVELYVS
jgi:hypothetical protein